MEIANAKVDLRGVVPGTPGWEAARAAVTASMVSHGFVIVAHGDALGPDLQHAVFGRAMPELFALPPETKQRAAPDDAGVLTTGYVGHVHGMAWESLRVEHPTDAAGFRRVADLLWPEGNAEFCETMVSFAKTVLNLQETVEVLTLEGLGVRAESVRAHLGTLGYGVRLAHYGAPLDTETCVSLPAHCDNSMDTAVVQHVVEGLEVHLGDGRWVAVPPEPGTFAIVAGDLLRVASNGRVPACLHRVRTPSRRERFTAQFTRGQKVGVEVRVLDDLVDEEHPLVFNPLRHEEYSKWVYSEEGRKCEDPLKAYCGVGMGDGVAAA
ncbi:unnamed protein product [Urochloa decumbens]|uniref:2-oxoglutarate-dependent dioxygenase DAO n=1 Tax=Urochloa decumbens TaxID=240449 RepID=A0ABC9C121_9POAL